MTLRRPVLRVVGPGATNLVDRWGSALLGVTITDQAGYESDECTIRMRRRPPYMAPPPKGTPYTVSIGWSDGGLSKTGLYTFQRAQISGSPEEGQEMHLVCRAGDYIDKLKAVGSAHYDAGNGFGTAGKIFRRLAEDAGLEPVIAAEIDAIEIPYRLRWQQSPADFATSLGDDLGAMVKPQAGKLLVTPRGGGQSGSGQSLPPVHVYFDPSYGFEVDLEPRASFEEVAAPWFDGAAGRIEEESRQTDQQQSRYALPHPYPTKDEAARAAGAAAQELGRWTGTGRFEMAGNAAAVAEAPVIAHGFGPGIDDVDWTASTVTHEIDPENAGWVTTVEVETKETAKAG